MTRIISTPHRQHVVSTRVRTCATPRPSSTPQAIHLAVAWSNHPAWGVRHTFDCLGRQAPRDVRLVDCIHTFTPADPSSSEERGVFEQLGLFDDGDFLLTKGTFRVDDGDPLTCWITHETAETLYIPPFETGLDETRLQYLQMGDVSRLSTTRRRGGRLTLWTKRFG